MRLFFDHILQKTNASTTCNHRKLQLVDEVAFLVFRLNPVYIRLILVISDFVVVEENVEKATTCQFIPK